jgi:hypothetical protein
MTHRRRRTGIAAALATLALLGCNAATQPTRHPVAGTWTGDPPSTTPSRLTLTLEDGGQAEEGQPNIRRIVGSAIDDPLAFPAVSYTVSGTFDAPTLTLRLSHPQRDPVTLAGQVRGDTLEATFRILDGEPSEPFLLTRASEPF